MGSTVLFGIIYELYCIISANLILSLFTLLSAKKIFNFNEINESQMNTICEQFSLHYTICKNFGRPS